jgi:peptidoglycan/xylan/chitin deacetylase (PgdA/CDA1 family)
MKAIALVFGLLGMSAQGFAAEPTFVWPHGERAAVSLAYDDALNSQLDIALPALNRLGLKASFYLTLSSDVVHKRTGDWRAAAANGHELGNHTLFHQCSSSAPDRSWVNADNDLDHTSVAQLVAQIRVGNTLLYAIDGKRERTFAAPCGELLVGGINYLGTIKGDFVGMKTEFGGIAATMQRFDPYTVSVAVPTDVSGVQLIDMVKRAADAGTMANITFHGVGGDYLTISKEAHAELLAYLAAHRDVYWTDTFINIMKYVISKQIAASGN